MYDLIANSDGIYENPYIIYITNINIKSQFFMAIDRFCLSETAYVLNELLMFIRIIAIGLYLPEKGTGISIYLYRIIY